MTISTTELHHLASLAYLNIDAAQEENLIEDINAIIDFVEHIQQVDTTKVTPMMHPIDSYQLMRDDNAVECNLGEELAKIAPAFKDNLYLVPKVIK